MILYKDKRFVTNSEHPNDDWIGDADLIIPDNSEISNKIIRIYPNFNFIFDDNGNVADVEEIETETAAMPTDHDRIEAVETAIMEIAELIAGVI